MYKVVYFDRCTGMYDDYSGDLESYQDAVMLFEQCYDEVEQDCFIVERIKGPDGLWTWEEA